jgi:hypothetical protein
MGLRKTDVATWASKRVENAIRERLDELKAIKADCGGTYANMPPEKAARVRELTKDIEVLGERLDESRDVEGVAENFASFEDFVGRVDDAFNKTAPGQGFPGYGRTKGAGGSGGMPGPVGWRQGHWADAFIQKLGASVTPSGTITSRASRGASSRSPSGR